MKTWKDALASEKHQPYFQQLLHQINTERQQGIVIYPPAKDVFNAFKLTEFSQVRIVILGQDPYHNEGQAHGLAFSVQKNTAVPPSLKNIYQELVNDIEGFQIPSHGNLTQWAKQGVLLLNTVLTVRAHQAHSHADYGWEKFTDYVIAQLNQHRKNLVFMLWGNHAQKKGKHINPQKHLILNAAHPSPLSAYRGFLGCQHFSQANNYLKNNNIQPINWQI